MKLNFFKNKHIKRPSCFYTQSRRVTLLRQRLTAAAGTLLARSSPQV